MESQMGSGQAGSKQDSGIDSAAAGRPDGERRRLSRERVLGAALALVDREGLSALSMRRVGTELDVEAMALYRYAHSKDELLDGLVEALFIELHEIAGPGGAKSATEDRGGGTPGWRQELDRLAQAMLQVSQAHPHVVPLLATRMLAVPLARRPLADLRFHERALAVLVQSGLDEQSVLKAYRAFTTWVLGYVFVELRAMVDDPDEPDPAFRLGLHRMPASEFPRLRELAPALAEGAEPQELLDGLDALLGSMQAIRDATAEAPEAVDGIGGEKAPVIVAELAEVAPVIDKLIRAGVNMTQPGATGPATDEFSS
jgi:AcrR family transcriptional regulator